MKYNNMEHAGTNQDSIGIKACRTALMKPMRQKESKSKPLKVTTEAALGNF
jgi:hypothetical protein